MYLNLLLLPAQRERRHCRVLHTLLGKLGSPRLPNRNAAVALSHMLAWRALLSSPAHAAVILEDDALLKPHFGLRAAEAAQRAARTLGDFGQPGRA